MVINGGYPAGMTCRAAVICWGKYSKKKGAILNFHNLAMEINKDPKRENKIDRQVHDYSSQLISVSHTSAESLRVRSEFSKTTKLGFIYNGIAPIVSQKSDLGIKKELGLPEGARMCLMLGSYEPRKGHDFLLKSFRKVVDELPGAHLVICGQGSVQEVAHVQQITNDLGLRENVHLQSFRNDLNVLLESTDLLLISSQAYESFGLTAVEAMARKVPVVATNTGGLKEAVKNGEGGFAFNNTDQDAYAAKVVELLKNSALRSEQGVKGYQRFSENFTASRMAEEYARLLHS